MAGLLVVGPNYKDSFTDGQGTSAATYFNYAQDLDLNFGQILVTVNQIIGELTAVQGPNAVISRDLIILDDSALHTTRLNNKVGVNSYRLSLTAPNVTVTGGAAIVAGTRIAQPGPFVLVGSGATDTHYFYITATGSVEWQDTASGQNFFIGEAEWTGTPTDAYTAVTNYEDIGLDGDEWEVLRVSNDGGTTLPQSTTYKTPSDRIKSMARLMSGFSTDIDATNFGAHAFNPGVVATPSVVFTDGAGVQDTAGWYRSAANAGSWTNGSVEILRVDTDGITVKDGTAALPSVAFIGSPTTGFYEHAASEIGVSIATADTLMIRSTGLRAAIAGTAANPFYSCDITLRDDGGMYFPVDNEVAISANSTEVLRITATQLKHGIAGTAAAPAYSSNITNRDDGGMFFPADNEIAFSANSTEVLRLSSTQLKHAIAGTAAAPVYSCDITNRDDSGMYFPADDTLALSTAGVKAIEIGPTGIITFPLQPRVRVRRSTVYTIADGDVSGNDDIDWEIEEEDVGGMWAIGSPDEIVVPTGGDGWYLITLSIKFDESTSTGIPNDGTGRGSGISINGTLSNPIMGFNLPHTEPNRDTVLHTSMGRDLVATDIIRGVAFQNSGGTMGMFGTMTAVKVA